jgi:uncharacterized damage-inducible protein DinB
LAIKSLIKAFEYDAEVIHNQLVNVSHKESLVQLTTGGHSMNWLFGHIVCYRWPPLQRVNADQVWTEEQRARYSNGSAPIGSDGPGVFQLPELIMFYNQTQERLIAGLEKMTGKQLNQPTERGDNTVLDTLWYYHFHETYHIGQMTMIGAHLGKGTAYRN